MKAEKFDLDYLSNMDDDSWPPNKKAKEALAQAAGKRVRRIEAQVYKPVDMEYLAACKQVQDLSIWSWQDLDFKRLSHLTPSALRLVRGWQSSLDGLNDACLRYLWIDGPSKIKTLGPLHVPRLTLAACNGLDLTSLGNM